MGPAAGGGGSSGGGGGSGGSGGAGAGRGWRGAAATARAAGAAGRPGRRHEQGWHLGSPTFGASRHLWREMYTRCTTPSKSGEIYRKSGALDRARPLRRRRMMGRV